VNFRFKTTLFILLFVLVAVMTVFGQQKAPDGEIETYLSAREILNQGKDLFQENKIGEAGPLFEEALRIFPQYADAYFFLARIHYTQGNLDLALQAIADAESHFNTTNRMEMEAATNEIQKNLVEQERRQFAADLYFVYGNIQLKKKDYRQAHEKYLEAVQYNPRHHQAFNNLIQLHLLLDNRDLAYELLKKAEESGVVINSHLKLETLAVNGKLDAQSIWKLTMKDGQVWTGSIGSREGGIVKVKTDLGELEFHQDRILSIEPYTGEPQTSVQEIETSEAPVAQPAAQEFRPVRRTRLRRLFFQLEYDVFSHASSTYRDVYGSLASFAVVNVGYRLSPSLFLKFGFNFLSQDGEVPGVGIQTETEQKVWALVLGYEGQIVERLGYQVEGGAFYIDYKEKVIGAQLGDSAIGFRLGGGLLYRFGDSVYTIVSVGYLNGSDTIGDKDVKLGGLYAGAGVGLLF